MGERGKQKEVKEIMENHLEMGKLIHRLKESGNYQFDCIVHCKIQRFFFLFGCTGSSCFCSGSSSCGERGLPSGCSARASHCGGFSRCPAQALGRVRAVEHQSFSSRGAQAQLLRSMWNLPRPGAEPVTSGMAGSFLPTGPPEKSQNSRLI